MIVSFRVGVVHPTKKRRPKFFRPLLGKKERRREGEGLKEAEEKGFGKKEEEKEEEEERPEAFGGMEGFSLGGGLKDAEALDLLVSEGRQIRLTRVDIAGLGQELERAPVA